MKSSFTHQLGDAYRKAVSMFSGVETKSQFEAKGTLTVKEFLEAGDALVFKFPTWQWSAAADKKMEKDYLPADKQYLVTKHVPCNMRVSDLDRNFTLQATDEWMTLTNEESPAQPPPQQAPKLEVLEEYDGLSRLDREMQATMQDDTVMRRVEAESSEQRSYDLSITWDKFYQTPRLWLRGYKDGDQPLNEKEVREDVLGDYASKTVTMEIHPATGEPTVSIHPCKHAEMMKRVIDSWKQNNKPVRSDLSLFVFLKFISSVVPTINYDFTFELEMN